jgi:hypothetical protein
MNLQKYMNLRRNAKVVRDEGGYRLDMGEANHVIFEDFVGELLERFPEPVIWEPFAGHTGRCKSCDFCEDIGVKLIAYDLNPTDFRVEQRDSTKYGPDERIQGVLFHPPYFGTSPMTNKLSDLSNAFGVKDYVEMLSKTISFIKEGMVMGGLVAAIGRDYRTGGERVRLDHWFLEIFTHYGFTLVEVWTSEPDVVLIFER